MVLIRVLLKLNSLIDLTLTVSATGEGTKAGLQLDSQFTSGRRLRKEVGRIGASMLDMGRSRST
jgi:hypothetical protein